MRHVLAHSRRAVMLALCLAGCSENPPEEAVGRGRSALQSAVWTKLSPPKDALERAGHAFVYDSARENCLVFGGRPVDDHGPSFDDTGLWTANTWVPVAARYARRGYVAAAFDTQRLSTIAYGGMDGVGHFADTWEFDGSSWSQLIGVSAPGNRSANGLAYDARRGVTVLFGGFDGRWKDDLWEWDGNAWTQRCNAPPCSEAPRPAARSRAVFVYDDARGVTLLFGGSRDGNTYEDTWTWDGEQWAQLWPSESPMARDLAAAAYDPVGKRVLIFGGLAPGLQELNDFWAWDGKEWANISQTRTPFARHGAGMAWDAKRKRGILFGGSAGDRATDAWEFHLLDTPCASSDHCHVGRCVDGSCSTVPPSSGSGGAESGGGGGIFAGGGLASGGSGASDASGGSAGSRPIEEGGASDGGEPGAASGGALAQEGGAPAAPGAGGSAGSGASGGTPAEPAGVSGAPSHARGPTRSFYSCAFAPAPALTRWPLAMLACLSLLRVLARAPGVSRRSAPKPSR